MVKRKKKREKVEEEQVIEPQLEVIEEEEEKAEVEFTDTSYTSASYESIADALSLISFDRRSNRSRTRRGKKRSARRTSDKSIKSVTSEFRWSDEEFDLTIGKEVGSQLLEPEPEEIPEQLPLVKESKKRKKKKVHVEVPDFPKPPTWRIMRKQERADWLANRIAEWEREKEEKKQEELANIKQKRKDLAEARAELKRQDDMKMEIRTKMLKILFKQFAKFKQEKMEAQVIEIEKEEWKRHILCDGTPNPHVPTELRQFLNFWSHEDDRYEPDNVDTKLRIVLPIINKLNQFIYGKRYTEHQIEIFQELQTEFRHELADIKEMVAYFLLRDLERNLTREDSTILTYHREFRSLNLNLWVAVKKFVKKQTDSKKSSRFLLQPASTQSGWVGSKRNMTGTSQRSLRNFAMKSVEEEPLYLMFPGVKASIKLPLCFGNTDLCVRAGYFDIDLLSEFSRTWKLPAKMLDIHLDLLQLNELEHSETYKLKERYDVIRNEFYKDARKRIKELQLHMKMFPYIRHDDTKEEIERLQLSEPPLLRGPGAENPRLVIMSQYERAFNRYLRAMEIRLRIGEINLRKYRILNGMLNLDVLIIPPQLKVCPFDVKISTVEPPSSLRHVPYHVRYHPPPIDDTFTAEQILAAEQRMRNQLETLVLITIELPPHLLFFENPIVCQWYPTKTMWTNVYINDFNYDAETRIVQFRTGILWPIGFATPRYCNHPLVSWEVKPQFPGSGVLVTVEGVYIKLTFLIRGLKITLVEVEKYENHYLEDTIGRPMSFVNLKRVLQTRGCFIFPAADCFLYVDDSCAKVSPMERHHYHVMGLLSRCYSFRMSKWNLEAGFRNIITQIREMYSPKYVFKWDLLHVTPRFVAILRHREETMPYNKETELTELSFDQMERMPFCPDLFTLAVKTGSIDVKRTTSNMQYQLTETVSEFLQSFRLCNF